MMARRVRLLDSNSLQVARMGHWRLNLLLLSEETQLFGKEGDRL
jgi:hypothetical protein